MGAGTWANPQALHTSTDDTRIIPVTCLRQDPDRTQQEGCKAVCRTQPRVTLGVVLQKALHGLLVSLSGNQVVVQSGVVVPGILDWKSIPFALSNNSSGCEPH